MEREWIHTLPSIRRVPFHFPPKMLHEDLVWSKMLCFRIYIPYPTLKVLFHRCASFYTNVPSQSQSSIFTALCRNVLLVLPCDLKFVQDRAILATCKSGRASPLLGGEKVGRLISGKDWVMSGDNFYRTGDQFKKPGGCLKKWKAICVKSRGSLKSWRQSVKSGGCWKKCETLLNLRERPICSIKMCVY